jgi:hypothetical protein
MDQELVVNLEGRTSEELHEMITRYVSEIRSLEEDRKAYVSGIRDTIKDLKSRIDAVLFVLDQKDAEK